MGPFADNDGPMREIVPRDAPPPLNWVFQNQIQFLTKFSPGYVNISIVYSSLSFTDNAKIKRVPKVLKMHICMKKQISFSPFFSF